MVKDVSGTERKRRLSYLIEPACEIILQIKKKVVTNNKYDIAPMYQKYRRL